VPELPDITVYVERLAALTVGQTLHGVRLASPFLLRTASPPIEATFGRQVVGTRRMGKRIVLELSGELFLVLHLMIAGRLHWKARGAPIQAKVGLAAFDFSTGTLLLNEASPKKRASLHIVQGEAGLREFERGGLEVMDASLGQFRRKSRRFGKTWRCTASTVNRAPCAAHRSSASSTPRMSPTTARPARPVESCSPIEPCLGC
jgi:formamidopyrimidine-DNA glycosylase